MRIPILVFAALVLAAPAVRAADSPAPSAASALPSLDGDWDASLAVSGQVLPMTMHIRSAQAAAATLDIPLQGLRGGPLAVSSSDGTFSFTLSNGAVFRLQPDPAGATLGGVLSQDGANLPIQFRKRSPPAPLSGGETAVQISGPLGPIKGSLALTSQAAKATAVLIQGSGPTDRNGDSPLGDQAGNMRLLAQALAGSGIQTVRYDKRGQFASQTAISDPNRVTMEEMAEDALSFAALAAQRAGQPCAWLIGHSEGGLVALVTARQPDKVCGLVLIATPGRRMGEILREQIAASAAGAPPGQEAKARALVAQANGAIDKLQAGRKVDTTGMAEGLLNIFDARVQDFIIDQMRYDPVSLAAAYKGPVFVVQGDNDKQVSMVDADRLAGARPGIQRLTLPGANHVLKLAPTERAANLATYADPNLPLAPGLGEAISQFILGPRP